MNLNTQVKRYNLDKVLVKGTVEHVIPVIEHKEENEQIKEQEAEGEARTVTDRKGAGSTKSVKYFQVQLQEGIILKARQVVMATGPTRAQMANIPAWVGSIEESYPEERLQHTVHLMHRLPAARQILNDTDCQKQGETFSTQGESDFFRELLTTTTIWKGLAILQLCHKFCIYKDNIVQL